jgi:hypothetical protein
MSGADGLTRSQVYQTQYADGGPLIARYVHDSSGRMPPATFTYYNNTAD